jgi:hypothetical protein
MTPGVVKSKIDAPFCEGFLLTDTYKPWLNDADQVRLIALASINHACRFCQSFLALPLRFNTYFLLLRSFLT